jgi:hypothetical protein
MPPMDISLDIAAFIAAVAWPVVLFVVLWWYHQPIETFLASRPVTSFSIAGVLSLDFGEAKEMAPRGSSPDIVVDLRHPTPAGAVIDAPGPAFAEQLKDNTPADYTVIDLGTGQEWLTSRLYILALLLRRMRGLKSFVFVETSQGVRRRYTGLAEPNKVRWELASNFPWLEYAFSRAYSSMVPNFEIASLEGKLATLGSPNEAWPAVDLLGRFLQEIQKPSSEPKSEEWVPVQTPVGLPVQFEHGQWLDAGSLHRYLGGSLIDSQVRSVDLYGKPNREQVKLLLHQPPRSARYVAVVREDLRFQRLLDRQLLLEEVARDAVLEGAES